jgi:thiamine biosynthesis lipoprotein
MGMPVSLAVRGPAEEAEVDRAWAAVTDSLRDADEVFSTWRADSWVSRLGRGEVTLAQCPPEVAEVLALGERARVGSAGAFDVRRPGASGATVLDPSGVVKGWAVQRASAALHTLAGTDWCLSAGGDLLCLVADLRGTPWTIGIEDPRDPSRLVARVPVRRGAVATSGTSHRGEHVVDARTGRPPRGVASVTVVGPDLTWADLDATAAFALGEDAARWLAGRPGRCGLVVWADGRSEVIGEQGRDLRLEPQEPVWNSGSDA